MSKTSASAGFNLSGSSTLYLDNAIFKERQNQLRQTSSQLKFDKFPFEMENEVCGTEGMLLLADYWHGVSKASDNLQSFFTFDVDKANTDAQNSINQTDSKIAGSFSTDPSDSQGNVYGALKQMQARKALENIAVSNISEIEAAVKAIFGDDSNLFTSVYNVDEATMEQAKEWIEEYKAGNPIIIEKMKKYQNLTAEDWENLSDEEIKEFTTLTVVYAWSNYVVEQGGDGTADLDTYKEISEKMTANLYSFNNVSEDGVYVEASADAPLLFSMKTAMESMGMSDSLAYNIATKVESDTNSYIVCDPQYQPNPKDVNVTYSYDESGFVSVNIEDSYVTDYPLRKKQFLATSRNHAAEYMNAQREGVSDYSNHGMTDDELIGMFQAVENPNDLKAMTNIAISDENFMVNGKNAFEFEYWEEDTSNTWNYDRGISDPFSVSMAQMGSTMLYRHDTENFGRFLDAAVESSVNGSAHNIVMDIATGAGCYADTCAMAVLNDEADPLGGGNDYPLKANLNAANATFGAFSQVYEKLEDDAKYSDINVGYISYSNQTGDISFNITADKETGMLWWKEKEEDSTITIDSTIESGGQARNDFIEQKQSELKKDLQRKKEALVVDTLIDLTGNINPLLKDGIYFTKDAMAASNMTMDSSNLVRDGIKAACSDSKNFNRGVSGSVTILGAFMKYDKMVKEYERDKAGLNDHEKLNLFYNYNTGSGTVGLYDYDTIRELQDWSDNGIVEVLGDCGKSNDDIYQSMYHNGELKNAVLKKIGNDVCDATCMDTFDELSNNPTTQEIAAAYSTIEEQAGYTKEEIENAMTVIIYGHSDAGEYHTVTDIPFDLQHACLDAIHEGDPSINMNEAWKNN